MAKSIPAFRDAFAGFKADESFFSDQVKTISFTIKSGGTPDLVNGGVTGGTTDIYTAEGFARDVKDKEFRAVEVGDLVFTCDQVELGYTPVVNDVAVINSVSYNVVEVNDKGNVVYVMQLRA